MLYIQKKKTITEKRFRDAFKWRYKKDGAEVVERAVVIFTKFGPTYARMLLKAFVGALRLRKEECLCAELESLLASPPTIHPDLKGLIDETQIDLLKDALTALILAFKLKYDPMPTSVATA